MPSVAELSAPYGNFMLAPMPGPSVCVRCFNLTDGWTRCYACAHGADGLAIVAPISYSVGHGQLHHVLASYKRRNDQVARRFVVELAAVLWRHLAQHERCIADAAGVPDFPLVTTVPSSDAGRDLRHPLHEIAGVLCGPTRDRYQRLLCRSDAPAPGRAFHPGKYRAVRELEGEPVLLIDDTWTTGASADSAAEALRAAGSGPVAVVTFARYLNAEWHDNDSRLAGLPRPFDWAHCARCAGPAAGPG